MKFSNAFYFVYISGWMALYKVLNSANSIKEFPFKSAAFMIISNIFSQLDFYKKYRSIIVIISFSKIKSFLSLSVIWYYFTIFCPKNLISNSSQ